MAAWKESNTCRDLVKCPACTARIKGSKLKIHLDLCAPREGIIVCPLNAEHILPRGQTLENHKQHCPQWRSIMAKVASQSRRRQMDTVYEGNTTNSQPIVSQTLIVPNYPKRKPRNQQIQEGW